MITLLDPRVWIAVLLLCLACYGAGRWQQSQADDKALLVAVAKASEKARSDERELQKDSDNITKVKNEKLEKSNRDLVAAIDGLRKRPERSSAVASNGESQLGCTGKELFRDDGEFLTRFAYDADKLKFGLEACYAQYEAARQTINSK